MKFLLSYDANTAMVHLEKDHFLALSEKLSETKALIDACPKEWDACKKMIHLHEYIYTSSFARMNIGRFDPVSRSYFKMKEMGTEYLKDIKTCVCLAEAPGGFVQCLLETSKTDIPTIYGITLISDDKRVPYWNRTLIRDERFSDLRGVKGNGDLIDFENVLSIIRDLGRGSQDLVTGDGGFDNSDDYNNQELNSLPLIYSEIYIALQIQRTGGTFICKLFDTFVKETVILIYLLTQCYDEVHLHKPAMSRLSNSEKYIVCSGYRGLDVTRLNYLTHHFHDHILDLPIQSSFLATIGRFNEEYSLEQIRSIDKGLGLIRDKKMRYSPTNEQVRVGEAWCKQYNIPINSRCQYLWRVS
jgi:23S rRNA U2552 (ribose-2'-O)-methylase RlmE/FtsJ